MQHGRCVKSYERMQLCNNIQLHCKEREQCCKEKNIIAKSCDSDCLNYRPFCSEIVFPIARADFPVCKDMLRFFFLKCASEKPNLLCVSLPIVRKRGSQFYGARKKRKKIKVLSFFLRII